MIGCVLIDTRLCCHACRLVVLHLCLVHDRDLVCALSWTCPVILKFLDLFLLVSMQSLKVPGTLLTDPASLDFAVLELVNGSLTFVNSVILDKAICGLEGDLCKPAIAMENVKDITL